MNKTISINLGGRNFIIEEEAQNKLQNYLTEIKKHCGIDADTEEVMADIEIGMAEKLKAALTPYKEIITVSDVNDLIKIMGTVEDFDREVGGGSANEEEETKENKVDRRLYRDTDNAILGGVAAGLGAYFDVDPIIFRIIFIALVFAGGSGGLIYLILWLITPAAKSAHQKLEMQGQLPTLAAFERLAKKTSSAWKNNNGQARSFINKLINLPFLALKYLFLALKKIWSGFWPFIKIFSGLFLTICSLIGLIVIGTGGLYLILQANSAYQLSFIPIYELTRSIPFVWIVTSGFLTLILPTTLVLIGGLSLLRKKTFIEFSAIAVLIGVWLAAIIGFSALSLRYFPEMKEKIDNYPRLQKTSQTIDVNNLKSLKATGRNLRVIIEPGATTTASISGRAVDLEKIVVNNSDGELTIKQEERHDEVLCISCWFKPITVKINTPNLEMISTDGSDTTISGQLASSSLNIKNATLRLDNINSENIYLNLSGRAYLTGKIKNLNVTSDADCGDECLLEAHQAQITTVDFNTAGAPIIILGATDKISGTLSDQSTLFYLGEPTIDESLKDRQIINYKKVNNEEIDDTGENDSDYNQKIIDINGQYFFFDQGIWTENKYRELRSKFQDLME